MSLLLDALKRAEQEKLAREAGRADGGLDAPAGPASRGESFELESIEKPRAGPGPAPASPGERASAQTVFAAKSPSGVLPTPSKAPIYVAAALVLLLIVAGGAYVWVQLNAITNPYAAKSSSSAGLKPITPAEQAARAAAPPAAGTGANARTPLMPPEAPVPPPASGVTPTLPNAPPVAAYRPETVSPGAKRAKPPAQDAERAVMGLLQESAQRPATTPPLKLARSMEQPRVSPDIAAGYDNLVRGDLAGARKSYQAALAVDANSVDALLGLATVNARSGERAAAARDYRKVLAIDASNPDALAGLAAIADYSRPDALEPTLKADIARYPQSAALQMTLGTLYASQSRWGEAQAAFFEAHRLDPANADVLYNLAVSLDNMNQPRLAGEYYRRAVQQARGRNVQFDARIAERRAAELPR
ncbi:hypothetical protein BWI17_08550 [Betaproteobacteria bacterium GR16-43]|nr:hypothetical protein BWI17_08550 [Betaproteobacteria bacterium GR16-43]